MTSAEAMVVALRNGVARRVAIVRESQIFMSVQPPSRYEMLGTRLRRTEPELVFADGSEPEHEKRIGPMYPPNN